MNMTLSQEKFEFLENFENYFLKCLKNISNGVKSLFGVNCHGRLKSIWG